MSSVALSGWYNCRRCGSSEQTASTHRQRKYPTLPKLQSRLNISSWHSLIVGFIEPIRSHIRCSQLQNMSKSVFKCVSLQTYRLSCSWFPVIPIHQLQVYSFALFYLLFQLVLSRKIWEMKLNTNRKQTKKHLSRIRKKLDTLSRGGKWTNPRYSLASFSISACTNRKSLLQISVASEQQFKLRCNDACPNL